MSLVQISSATRTNLRALQGLAQEVSNVQKRLATGKKVASAFDNPAAYFTASAMKSRASALSGVLDGIKNAQGALSAAKTAIDGIQSLVQNARNVAEQALASPDTLARYTGTVTGLTGTSSTGLATGRTIMVSDGTTTATFTMAGGRRVQDILDAVNNTSGLNVTASLVNGSIQLRATSTNNITIGGTATANELAATGLVAGTTNFIANPTRTSLAAQFDALRGQIDDLVRDAGINGINLLGGDSLDVALNEGGSTKMTVLGLDVTAQNLGIAAVPAGATGNFQLAADIEASLAQIEAAEGLIQSYATRFGSYVSGLQTREDFTASMIDLLQSGADDLVLSDTNADSAELLALQTRQQIALTSLSLTTQGEQSILRMFG